MTLITATRSLSLAALAAGTAFGAGMALFYFVAYLFSNMGAFLCIAAVEAGGGEEGGDILRLEDDGHAFLRFGQGDLGTIEAVILERHAVEVDVDAGHLRTGGGETMCQGLTQAASGTGNEDALRRLHGQLLRV